MDKLQEDKLTEIRKFHKNEEELLRILPLTKAAQVHEYITYLLQLVETQAQALEEANIEVDFWRISAENQQKNNFTLLEKIETQAKALDEAEGMSKRWEKAFVNADKQYLKMEKKAAELRRKLEALTQV